MLQKLEVASKNISDLQDKVSRFEANQFCLDKIKDDNDAIMFYTSFPNYQCLIAVFKYLEGTTSRLQYWKGQNTNSEKRANRSTRLGKKHKLSLLDEFFMVLFRLKVGLFVRDISERFGISAGWFS